MRRGKKQECERQHQGAVGVNTSTRPTPRAHPAPLPCQHAVSRGSICPASCNFVSPHHNAPPQCPAHQQHLTSCKVLSAPCTSARHASFSERADVPLRWYWSSASWASSDGGLRVLEAPPLPSPAIHWAPGLCCLPTLPVLPPRPHMHLHKCWEGHGHFLMRCM